VAILPFLTLLLLFTLKHPQPSQQNNSHHDKDQKRILEEGEEENETKKKKKWKMKSVLKSISELLSDSTIIIFLIASSLRHAAGKILANFISLYFEDQFPGDSNAYSLASLLILTIIGSIGAFLGGFLTDKWEHSNPLSRVDIPILAIISAIPFAVGMFSFPSSFPLSIASFGVYILLIEFWVGPAYSIQQNIFPNHLKGVGFSLFSSTLSFTGSLLLLLFSFFDDISSFSLAICLCLFLVLLNLSSVISFLSLRCTISASTNQDILSRWTGGGLRLGRSGEGFRYGEEDEEESKETTPLIKKTIIKD